MPQQQRKFDKDEFWDTLHEFMNKRKTTIARIPQLGHKEIDLYLLYKLVTKSGGLEEVVVSKGWRDIINKFDFPSTCTNAGYNLRLNYLKFLYPFERKYFHGLPDDQLDDIPPTLATSSKGKDKEKSRKPSSEDDDQDEGEDSDVPFISKRTRTPTPKTTRLTRESASGSKKRKRYREEDDENSDIFDIDDELADIDNKADSEPEKPKKSKIKQEKKEKSKTKDRKKKAKKERTKIKVEDEADEMDDSKMEEEVENAQVDKESEHEGSEEEKETKAKDEKEEAEEQEEKEPKQEKVEETIPVLNLPSFVFVEPAKVAVFQSANYSKTPMPQSSNRLKLSKAGITVPQRTLVAALEGGIGFEDEIEWALNQLTVQTCQTDFILRPLDKLLDVLLSMFKKYWDRVFAKDKECRSLFQQVMKESMAQENKNKDSMEDRSLILSTDTERKEVITLNKIATILRNFAFVQENEKYLISHPTYMEMAMKMITCEDMELVHCALDIFANIAPSIVLNNESKELLDVLCKYLLQNRIDLLRVTVCIISKLTESLNNFKHLATLEISFFRRLVEIIYMDEQLREHTFTALCNIAVWGASKTKIMLAEETGCIKTMFHFLSQQNGGGHTPLATKAILTLYHLSFEPKNNLLFLPYQEYLVQISLADNSHFARIASMILLALTEEETVY